MKPGHSSRLVVLAALLVAALPLHAGGLYIYEVNPADTIRPQAVWLNPAGMTSIRRESVQAIAAFLEPELEFDSDVATGGGDDGGDAGSLAVIPDVAYVRPLGDNWWAGFSMLGVFGGAIDYGDNFVGRYAVTEVELGGVGFVPSLAYKVSDRFSVGGGVGIIYATLDQKIAVNNPFAADGRVHFDELDDWGYQPYVGLNYRVSDRTLLGLVYRAEMDVEFEGDAEFSNIIPALNPVSRFKRDVQVEWTNAQTIEVGLQHRLDDDRTLVFSGSWQDWSVFDDNVISLDPGTLIDPVTLERNWKDTWSFGASYIHFFARDAFTVGFNYESSPVDDEDRTFDLPFDESLKLSATYYWRPAENLTYGLGASIFFGGDAEIDQTAQGVRAAGEFDTNRIYALTASLRYFFD